MQELENSVWKTVDVLTGRTPSSSECIGDLRQMKGISHCEARRVMTPRSTTQERGFTLLELIVAAPILAILTLMALPIARVTIKRQKEKQNQAPLQYPFNIASVYLQYGYSILKA